MARVVHKAVLPLLLLTLLSGCATVPLDSARRNFNTGRLAEADQDLATLPPNADKVMNLMERGMIRHLRCDYTNSTADWLQAVKLLKELETHSVTKAGASLLVNDNMLAFRGYPYERTYLHVYLGKNYLAQGLWEDAGVEARAIALALEKLDGFPDDAFSHYFAAVCLELCGDDSNAAMQYRQAARVAPGAGIDDRTGRFLPPSGVSNAPPATLAQKPGPELICFLDFDGVNGIVPDHADLYAGGVYLGSSRTLSNTLELEVASSEKMMPRRTAKTLGRLALKGAIALAASAKDSDLGNMVWLFLLATEAEDMRRWSTLPTKLAVARVPCPEQLANVEIDYMSIAGISLKRVPLPHPLTRRGRLYISLCRDYP